MRTTKLNILAYLAIMILISIYLLSYSVSASGAANISLSSANVKAGDRINLTLSVSAQGEAIQNGDLKINFPSNVRFESYTPNTSIFDAYNANIFNSPPGSSSAVISFVSSKPVNSGIVGTVQITGLNVGSSTITLTEVAANDSTSEAEVMTVSVNDSTINVLSAQDNSQSNNSVDENTTTALVPEFVASNEPASQSPQPTNSVIQESAIPQEENELSSDSDKDSNLPEENTLLELQTNSENRDFNVYITVAVASGILIFSFIGFKFLKKRRTDTQYPVSDKNKTRQYDISSPIDAEESSKTSLNKIKTQEHKPGEVINPKK